MEVLHEILEVYDTFPKTNVDEEYFTGINEKARNSQVKLKLHFYNDTKIIKAFKEVT